MLMNEESAPYEQEQVVSVPDDNVLPARSKLSNWQKLLFNGVVEKEKRAMKSELNAQLPKMTVTEVKEFRNSYKHRMSVLLLRDGFHKSYAEIYQLMKDEVENRKLLPRDSPIHKLALLEFDRDKCDVIAKHLCSAEAALRDGRYLEVYENHYYLAKYFTAPSDKWLSEHFYNNCLTYSKLISDESGRMYAEGQCNFGESIEANGKLCDALQSFKNYYAVTRDHDDWLMPNGQTMHGHSIDTLVRINTEIAERSRKEHDLAGSLHFFTLAFRASDECDDPATTYEAMYQLGVAFERSNKPLDGLEMLRAYLDYQKRVRNKVNTGRAFQAIAKCYKKLGNLPRSAQSLKQFEDAADINTDPIALNQVQSDLGALFNVTGESQKSVDYFKESFQASLRMNLTQTVQVARVHYGIAVAHTMVVDMTSYLESRDILRRDRLFDWKDLRQDQFMMPLSTIQYTERRQQKQVKDLRNERDELRRKSQVGSKKLTAKQRRLSQFVGTGATKPAGEAQLESAAQSEGATQLEEET